LNKQQNVSFAEKKGRRKGAKGLNKAIHSLQVSFDPKFKAFRSSPLDDLTDASESPKNSRFE